MNFDSYINQAWSDHAHHTEKVAKEFMTAAALVESSDQLIQLIGLITHVMGEHLGRWEEGISLLQSLQRHTQQLANAESERAILRSIASLRLGSGESTNLGDFNLSDQIRVLTLATSAVSGRNVDRAKVLLSQSLELAKSGLDRKDPANRALAITGNNLACELEEKSTRSPQETDLMILAAKTGRIYWELAGTWLEVSRAEYRLAMSYVKAGEFAQAFFHAQECAALCHNNKASDLDVFFCFEALAIVEHAKNNKIGFQKAVDQAKHYFEELSQADKAWCEKSLKNLCSL